MLYVIIWVAINLINIDIFVPCCKVFAIFMYKELAIPLTH